MLSNTSKKIIKHTLCCSQTIHKAVKIAIVVGTILNIINQGDFILNMMFESINYFKLILTYFVPFFVSTYTAININLSLNTGSKLVVPAELTCGKCGSSMSIKENTIIPKCATCGYEGHWTAK